jgi:hypothetical protein
MEVFLFIGCILLQDRVLEIVRKGICLPGEGRIIADVSFLEVDYIARCET